MNCCCCCCVLTSKTIAANPSVGVSPQSTATTVNNPCAIEQQNQPGVFTSIMADTVGVIWSAATGTVDPWTKEINDAQAAASLQAASNGSISFQQAQQQQAQTSTASLSGENADPSQAMDGLLANLNKLNPFNFQSPGLQTFGPGIVIGIIVVGGILLAVALKVASK